MLTPKTTSFKKKHQRREAHVLLSFWTKTVMRAHFRGGEALQPAHPNILSLIGLLQTTGGVIFYPTSCYAHPIFCPAGLYTCSDCGICISGAFKMKILSHYTCLCRDKLAVWRGNTDANMRQIFPKHNTN